MKKKKKEVVFERVQPWDHLLCRYCAYPFAIINKLECPNCKCSVDFLLHGLKDVVSTKN